MSVISACICVLHDHIQVDAQLQVVRKLEEKERLLQGTISAAERELTLRTQALDMNKRKVMERSQLQCKLPHCCGLTVMSGD